MTEEYLRLAWQWCIEARREREAAIVARQEARIATLERNHVLSQLESLQSDFKEMREERDQLLAPRAWRLAPQKT